jgi:hypothetical protein
VLQLTQKYQQSWLYWIYKSYGKNWGASIGTENLALNGSYGINYNYK